MVVVVATAVMARAASTGVVVVASFVMLAAAFSVVAGDVLAALSPL
jgi:hypothetical protein